MQGSRLFAMVARSLLTLALLSAGLHGVPAARAIEVPTGNLITLVSEPGEYVGQGQSLQLTDADTTFAWIVSTSRIRLTAVTEQLAMPAEFIFETPDGSPLRPGLHRDPFHPFNADPSGLDISADSRGCAGPNGRFEIRELVVADGQVTRAWIAFQQRCEQLDRYLWGEIRFNMPETDGVLAPGSLWWPDEDRGRVGATAIVALRPVDGPLSITGATIRGPGAPAFRIVSSTCSGTSLAPSQGCEIGISMAPVARGTHIAWVDVEGSHPTRIGLSGSSPQSRSSWVMDSGPDDFVGQTLSYAWTTHDASITNSGSRLIAHFRVEADDGNEFHATFRAANQEPLAIRRYDGATRGFSTTTPKLTVTGNNRGCNEISGWFDVRDLAWDAEDNLTRFAATFSQSCDGDSPLTGTIEWQIPEGDRTPPPRPVIREAVRGDGAVRLEWTHPVGSDAAYTAVRVNPGDTPPAIATAGGHGDLTTATSTSIAIEDDRATAIAVFALDARGNPSSATTVVVPASGDSFSDTATSPFRAQIDWLVASGLTSGCGVFRFCPELPVTRGQMASLLARALELPAPAADYFDDDDGTTHEADINRLRAAGIAMGCGPSRYCPGLAVSRAQMASFLRRALDVPGASQDYFRDDAGLTHEPAINAVRSAGMASGCAADRYCPARPVTRDEMAALLFRALSP